MGLFNGITAQGDDTLILSSFNQTFDENGSPFIVSIQAVCDASRPVDYPPSYPTVQGSVYIFKWHHPFACAVSAHPKEEDGMSAFAIFCLILFFVIFLYFVGGSIYRRNVMDKKGIEILPHHEFWLSIPSKMKVLNR